MPKRRNSSRHSTDKKRRWFAKRRRISLLGLALAIVLIGAGFARLAARRSYDPAQPLQPQGAGSLTLSKEYIYAGGRLVATEEPTPPPAACTPSSVKVIISEFRFRGPQGAGDEFIELYNSSNTPISVCATDGSAGWTIATRNAEGTAIALVTIPNGTSIPTRGHYLSTGPNYSLGTNANSTGLSGPGPISISPAQVLSTPGGASAAVGVVIESGNTFATNTVGSLTNAQVPQPMTVVAAATSLTRLTSNGDIAYSGEVLDNSGVALFSTSNPANFTLQYRLDAAGFSSMSGPNADLYREGSGLQPVSGDGEYSFVRRIGGDYYPQDTSNNAGDFFFISTTGGTFGGVISILGAPAPENVSSPMRRNIGSALFDLGTGQSSPPNRVICSTCTGPNAPRGTITVRRTYTNNTGQTVTRLRFRIYDLTTLNSPGYVAGGSQADLRVLSSSDSTVSRTDGSTAAVKGAIVETPPEQPSGGGLNTGLLLPLTDAGLQPGESINAQFLIGIQQGGYYRFYIIMEALP